MFGEAYVREAHLGLGALLGDLKGDLGADPLGFVLNEVEVAVQG